ncbi:MAG: histidine kinase dimerization/phospho-acceptor domain-containing protein [Gemmatimonadota bacterium]
MGRAGDGGAGGNAHDQDVALADWQRLVARVAGDIGHELKNPVHATVINLELVRRRIADGLADQALERLDVVAEQVRRVHGVVEGLLQLLGDGVRYDEAIELDRVVESVLPLLAAQAGAAGVGFRWTPAGPGTVVQVSADPLRHALVGLVASAVDSLGGSSGGGIHVRAVGPPIGVEVSATAAARSSPGTATPDVALHELVRRVAARGGMEIGAVPDQSPVSWSSTVFLAAHSGA